MWREAAPLLSLKTGNDNFASRIGGCAFILDDGSTGWGDCRGLRWWQLLGKKRGYMPGFLIVLLSWKYKLPLAWILHRKVVSLVEVFCYADVLGMGAGPNMTLASRVGVFLWTLLRWIILFFLSGLFFAQTRRSALRLEHLVEVWTTR